jgi:hypothetical protein
MVHMDPYCLSNPFSFVGFEVAVHMDRVDGSKNRPAPPGRGRSARGTAITEWPNTVYTEQRMLVGGGPAMKVHGVITGAITSR